MPVGFQEEDFNQIGAVLKQNRRVKRGEFLFHAGETFTSLFAIRTGFFKTAVSTQDGRDQVTGLFMSGELVGTDGICLGKYACDAVALEDADVCVVPFSELESIGRRFPPLQQRLHRIISREIVRDQGLMMLLGTMRAEERIGAFLLELSRRFMRRGFSSSQFILRMTREEIGNYLGLKLETVSRTLSRLQEQGVISVEQRKMQIISHDRLRVLSGVPESGLATDMSPENARRVALMRIHQPWSESQSSQ